MNPPLNDSPHTQTKPNQIKQKNSQLQSKREMFFKGEAQSPSGPPPNPPTLINNAVQVWIFFLFYF